MRYSLFSIPYILVLALFGKKLILFQHIIIGFPVWQTISRWRTKYIDKNKICLNGSPQSIENMIGNYIANVNDKRVVLVIDAASVSARVAVKRNGEVKGLLVTKWTNESEKIISSPIEFSSFVKGHEDEIIRYFFIVYICSLCPTVKNFPIALIPKCSGNANQDFVKSFKEIIKIVQNNLSGIGVSFDGDTDYAVEGVFVHLYSPMIITS